MCAACRYANVARTGTRVMENRSAPTNAATTVFAMGAKIRPSTRSSRKIGR